MKTNMKKIVLGLLACASGFYVHAATTASGSSLPADAFALTGPAIVGHAISSSTATTPNTPYADAFENVTKDKRWLIQSKSFNLIYTFARPICVNAYGNCAGGAYWGSTRAPKTWTIYGSNDCLPDGSNDATATWVQLDSRANETGWSNNQYRFYTFDNSARYRSYKIHVTTNNGDAYTQWKYFEFVSTAKLQITGFPFEFGDASPTYGTYDASDFAPAPYVFSAMQDGLFGMTNGVCTGYKIYTQNVDLPEVGTANTFSWDEFPTVSTRIEWQYDIQYAIQINNPDNGSGSATADAALYPENANATLTATPSDGYVFFRWNGDVPNESVYDNPLTLTMNGAKVVTPIFIADGAGNASIRYVSPDGDDANSGLYEFDSLASITNAIALLKSLETPGGIIYVAPGTYEQTSEYLLDCPIQIIGAGTGANPTILRETMNDRIASLTASNAILANLIVENGVLKKGTGNNYGAGVYVSAGVVSNCVIRNCSSFQLSNPMPKGAGVCLSGPNAVLTHSIVSNCVSSFDTATWGSINASGVHVLTGRVEQTLIANNPLAKEKPAAKRIVGGLYIENGSAVNCSVLNCLGSAEGGIFVPNGKTPGVTNCVVFGCQQRLLSGEDLNVTTTGLVGPAGVFVNCKDEAAGVTVADFVDYAKGQFKPNYGGQLFDAGFDVVDAPATDLAGNVRVQGAHIDIGAFEGSHEAVLQIVGEPDIYGVANPTWGNHTDLSGEITVTVNEEWIDGDARAVCTGWSLFVDDGNGFKLVQWGEGASATITVPEGHSRLKWSFTKYHSLTMNMIGEGVITAPSWGAESNGFAASVQAAEGWKILGWTDYLGRICGQTPGIEQVMAPTTYYALAIPAKDDYPLQYVNVATGNDENDGLTPETAKATVAAGLIYLQQYGDFGGKLFIAPGIYPIAKESQFSLITPIEILGESRAAQEDVVFDYSESDKRAMTINHPSAKVSGVTIANCRSYGGGILTIGEEGGVITNCIVRDSFDAREHNARGAIHATGSKSLVTHSKVFNFKHYGTEGPWVSRRAAGISLDSGARAEICLVSDCVVMTVDGIEKVDDTYVPKSVGGIFVGGNSAAINCTVINCFGTRAGGIYLDPSGVATNCVAIGCGYVTSEGTSSVGLNGADSRADLAGTIENYVKCAGDNETPANETCYAGATMAAFRHAENGDYRPAPGSILLNHGAYIPEWKQMKDLNGKPRLVGSSIDIGAMEANGTGFAVIVR